MRAWFFKKSALKIRILPLHAMELIRWVLSERALPPVFGKELLFMQSFNHIYELTLEHADRWFRRQGPGFLDRPELCPPSRINGRVLLRDLVADRDIPPYNRAAVDGYACRKEDLDRPLQILGTVAAGEVSELRVTPGTCVKVMTGGVVPQGGEIMVMVESTEVDAEGRMVFRGSERERSFSNISLQGEDVALGERVLAAGTILRPGHTALMASVGVQDVPVVPAPRIGILSTGDEVVEPSESPLPHQIRNANAWQIFSQLGEINLSAVYYGIVPDDQRTLTETIAKAQSENDVVLMSGGVSMGDFDLAPGAMKDNGYEILYSRVAVKPGKPTTFAVSEKGDLFGLPGNPVSCFVIFEILVKPYLYRRMGTDYRPRKITAPMGENFSRKKTEREEWIPVTVGPDSTLSPVPYHGSGHYHAVALADGMVKLERGQSQLKKGDPVAVRLF